MLGHCSFSTGFGALGMVCWPGIPFLTLCFLSGNWRFESGRERWGKGSRNVPGGYNPTAAQEVRRHSL